MTKKLIRRVEELFVAKLQAKTGWGRNEVLALFKDAVAEAAMELLDNPNTESHSARRRAQNRGVPDDSELPGMWSASDLIGGEADTQDLGD